MFFEILILLSETAQRFRSIDLASASRVFSTMAANSRRSYFSFLKKVIANWNITNFRVIEDPWRACFTVPGLDHECYDRDGNPKMNSLMTISNIARVQAFYGPYNDLGHTFLDWETLSRERLAFVSSAEFQVSPKMYDPDIPKNVFDMVFSLGYVGNASFAVPIEMFLPGDQEPIFKQTFQFVSVCKNTFKPLAFPDWFQDKFKGKGVMSSGLVVKPNPRPAQTFVYKSKVAWSDTDSYNHTNFASNARFSIDALHAALLEQKKNQEKEENHGEFSGADLSSSPIKGITKDIIQHGLKNMRICYLSESSEGQNLDTHVWQVDGKKNVVFCSTERDKVPNCDMTLEYFDSSQ